MANYWPMPINIIFQQKDPQPWVEAFRDIAPDLHLEVWPTVSELSDVEAALVWKPPKHLLGRFPNLKWVASAGAGVDDLLADRTIPSNVAITRVSHPSLAEGMADYVVAAIGSNANDTASRRKSLTVGLLGYGVIGEVVAGRLVASGYQVRAWSNSRKTDRQVEHYCGRDQLDDFLADAQVLVCLLPLTEETENILSAELFAKLPRGAYLINVARGRHLVDADLLAALTAEQLSGACLDVFREEPLPPSHPFLKDARITVTPHIASVTDPQAVAPQIIDNYRRLLAGQNLLNRVDRIRGY